MGMQNDARAGGHQGICMELLVAVRGQVALVSGDELVEVIHLAPKARTGMIRRKDRYMPIQRFEGAELGLKEGITCGLPEQISGRAFEARSAGGQSTGVLVIENPAQLRLG